MRKILFLLWLCVPLTVIAQELNHEEMIAFGEARIKPTFTMLLGGKYPIVEVQDRFTLHVKSIGQKFLGPRFTLATNYHSRGSTVGAISRIEKGEARVILSLPACYNVFRRLTNASTQADQKFETFLLVNFMHELDHIALDCVVLPGSQATKQIMLNYEQITWSATVEFTIVPLVEKHNLPLDFSISPYYAHWVKFGKNAQDTRWKGWIKKSYVNLHK